MIYVVCPSRNGARFESGAAKVWNMGKKINLGIISVVHLREKPPGGCLWEMHIPPDVIRFGNRIIDDRVEGYPRVMRQNGQLWHSRRAAGGDQAS